MTITILNTPDATIIPCRYEESGIVGLYDTINDVFYSVKDTADGIWAVQEVVTA